MAYKSKLAAAGSVVVMLVVAGVARVVGRAASEEGIHAYQQHEAAGQIDHIESSAGPFAAFYKELGEVDPARLESIKAEMKNAIASGASQDDVSARMQDYGKQAMTDYRHAAPKGSDADVREIARDRLAVLKLAQSQGDEDCARLASTGVWPGMTYGPGMKEALGAMAASLVRAGHDGMVTPVIRPEPTDAQYTAFGQKLARAGMTEAETKALSRNDFTGLSAGEQCDAIVTLFDEAVKDNSPNLLAQLIQE
jgi:hypothetical protein